MTVSRHTGVYDGDPDLYRVIPVVNSYHNSGFSVEYAARP